MKSIIKKIISLTLLLTWVVQVWAFTPFRLEGIDVKGLKRIKYGTVLNYVPVNTGQRIDKRKVDSIVRSLYKTGFFKSVNVLKHGNRLVIEVQEKPTIASIVIIGNKLIPAEQVSLVLQQVDLVEGRIFNEAIFTKVKDELERQYALQGHYGARVDVEKKYLPDNRIKVLVNVHEGHAALVRDVEIKGNHAFSESRLRSQMLMQPTNFWNWLFNKDHYGRERLEGSLEAIRSFYLDRGYIDMKIVRHHVLITPDKQYVYLKVEIEEGERFHFSGYRFRGRSPVSFGELDKVVLFHEGDVFSREKMNKSVERITDKLGDYGYLPQVSAEPEIDRKTHRVFVNFSVKTGPRVFVRRISFNGNSKTADYVLRYSMKQHEGERFSVRHVRESERRLRLLEYFEDVSTSTTPVPNTNNQVDIEFKLKEKPAAKATVSAGYGGNAGFQFGASVNQPNFLGTGRIVGVDFSTNSTGQNYSFNYYNPYYYSNRIGRGFNFNYKESKFGRRNEVANYRSTTLLGGMNYNILLTDYSSLQFGFAGEHLRVPTYENSDIVEYNQFYQRNGNRFDSVKFIGGWGYNSYDRFPFPTYGVHQTFEARLSVPPSSGDLSHYKLYYRNQSYYPLFDDYVLMGGMSLGYGNGLRGDDYPLYENFIGGGLGFAGQVRGFYAGSLGPKGHRANGFHESIGGNVLATTTLGLTLPYPLSQGSVRSSLFVDAGNVYARNLHSAVSGKHSGPVRVSSGIGIEWRSPFGPMTISIAHPINEQSGDRTRYVDFTVSTGF